MRIHVLVTVAALAVARDSLRAQQVSVMTQAVPLVTRADPTATRGPLTEGYLSQPAIMAHAAWGAFRGVGTLNLEGLTLERGELTTGGYGEGYVDRRHPHSYIHEALVGMMQTRGATTASLYAGRGFAPFGSDDPMVRPFEKFPVNHHLAQVLERLVTVAAIRRGPLVGEVALFNGDEPVSPSEPSSLRRFGDSWSARATAFPLAGAEVAASYAAVKSPEVRSGGGIDQRKASVVARYAHESASSARYAMLEWAHTGEYHRAARTASLSSVLGEASYCRAGAIVAARVERTDRPEEESLLDPFRTPRPSVDLANLGVSRWTGVTLSLSSPPARAAGVTGRPFVEVARMAVEAGSPAGLFNPEQRYGAHRMWMLSAGIRLHAGAMHERMGRYGAAMPAMSGAMPGMAMNQSSNAGQCVP